MSFIKLNTYGSSFGNPGYSNFGGICRDSNGRWVSSYHDHCGKTTTMFMPCSLLFFMVCSMRETRVSDILWLKQVLFLPFIWSSINSLASILSLLWLQASRVFFLSIGRCIYISHTLREDNACVDVLAKKGASGLDLLVNHICYSRVQNRCKCHCFPSSVVVFVFFF